MRKVLVMAYAIMITLLCACERENTLAEQREATRKKLMGYWQLEQKRVEIFDPFPTLQSETVYVGTAADFLQFKAHDSVVRGEAGRPVSEQQGYINVTTVIIPPSVQNWFIDTLNGHRLVLSCHVRNDDISNKSRRERLYFRR